MGGGISTPGPAAAPRVRTKYGERKVKVPETSPSKSVFPAIKPVWRPSAPLRRSVSISKSITAKGTPLSAFSRHLAVLPTASPRSSHLQVLSSPRSPPRSLPSLDLEEAQETSRLQTYTEASTTFCSSGFIDSAQQRFEGAPLDLSLNLDSENFLSLADSANTENSGTAFFKVSRNGTLRARGLELNQHGLHRGNLSKVALMNLKLQGKNRTNSTAINMVLGASDLVPLGILGAGASGLVEKMLCVPLFAIVAIKGVDVDASTSGQMMRELTAFMKIEHPRLLGFFGAFYHNMRVHFILEYMNRGSLHSAVVSGGPLGEGFLRSVIRQMLEGLDYLHSRNLVHFDVKPTNILLNSAGEVKLADLGLLKKERTDLAKRSSKPGAGGTLRYQAPEWMTGSNAVTCISDVWSLGLTLIFCATGSLPLPTDYWGLVGVLRSTEPITLPANNGLSRDCNDFLQRCLVRDPAERATVKDLLQHPWVAAPAVVSTGATTVPLPMEPEMEERLARKDENDLKDLQVVLRALIQSHLRFGMLSTSVRTSASSAEINELAETFGYSPAAVRLEYERLDTVVREALARTQQTQDRPRSRELTIGVESIRSPRSGLRSIQKTRPEDMMSPRNQVPLPGNGPGVWDSATSPSSTSPSAHATVPPLGMAAAHAAAHAARRVAEHSLTGEWKNATRESDGSIGLRNSFDSGSGDLVASSLSKLFPFAESRLQSPRESRVQRHYSYTNSQMQPQQSVASPPLSPQQRPAAGPRQRIQMRRVGSNQTLFPRVDLGAAGGEVGDGVWSELEPASPTGLTHLPPIERMNRTL